MNKYLALNLFENVHLLSNYLLKLGIRLKRKKQFKFV